MKAIKAVTMQKCLLYLVIRLAVEDTSRNRAVVRSDGLAKLHLHTLDSLMAH